MSSKVYVLDRDPNTDELVVYVDTTGQPLGKVDESCGYPQATAAEVERLRQQEATMQATIVFLAKALDKIQASKDGAIAKGTLLECACPQCVSKNKQALSALAALPEMLKGATTTPQQTIAQPPRPELYICEEHRQILLSAGEGEGPVCPECGQDCKMVPLYRTPPQTTAPAMVTVEDAVKALDALYGVHLAMEDSLPWGKAVAAFRQRLETHHGS